ncbi:lactate/malate family dehydrogenase [Propionivibrio sp.]|uniref:lactate/malate family dehydrogenase n=1 Tax=Propionivibrio sp. TaxID=2212460 RepID=UPI003BF2110A
MDISVIGASGSCGREVVTRLVSEGVLGRGELLQLVGGNPDSVRPSYLHGLRADLQDAYAENIPELDVTDNADEIVGDIVVMAAGATFPTDAAKAGSLQSRDDLARANAPLFEHFAAAVARNRKGNPPVVIVLSNPVELGVHVFCRHLPRECVLGMGSFSDSQRFRWEIASQLGVGRQRVHASMGGEHGLGMMPLWSTVRIHGLQGKELAATIARLRDGTTSADYAARLASEHAALMAEMMADPINGPVRAIARITRLPPDLRVALKPFPVHYSQAKTISASATATVELVKALCEGRAVEICAQYQHCGELGIHGPIGNRVILEGAVRRVVPGDDLTEEEITLLQACGIRCSSKIKEWTHE